MNRKSYKRGRIVEVSPSNVRVEYDEGIVSYQYPSAFADTLLLEDEKLQEEILSSGREASFQEFIIMRCDSDSGKKLIKSMVLRTADRQGMC